MQKLVGSSSLISFQILMSPSHDPLVRMCLEGRKMKKLSVRHSEVNSLAILSVAGVREACDVGKSFDSSFE
jgi:hypothetical protein